jgi:hypothetical protein
VTLFGFSSCLSLLQPLTRATETASASPSFNFVLSISFLVVKQRRFCFYIKINRSQGSKHPQNEFAKIIFP